MNVPQEELNDWLRKTQIVNGRLLSIIATLTVTPETRQTVQVAELAQEVQHHVNGLKQALERAGAEDTAAPMRSPSASLDDLPLELLTSPTNHRYCEALRVAYEYAIERDKERGWYPDGPGEVIGHWLKSAEEEVYGASGRE